MEPPAAGSCPTLSSCGLITVQACFQSSVGWETNKQAVRTQRTFFLQVHGLVTSVYVFQILFLLTWKLLCPGSAGLFYTARGSEDETELNQL